MSQQVSQSFVRQYESQAHILFQRKGAKLLNLTRYVNNVEGRSTTFQRVGRGQARQKGRNGLVPLMNQDHTPIECTLTDQYAADIIDVQDLEKLNIDEKMVTIQNGVNAIGRTFDNFIFDALDTLPTANQDNTGGVLTLDKIYTAYEFLGNNDALEDGMNVAVVSPRGWNDLMDIDQFSNADYVDGDLPFQGMGRTKYWLDTYWLTHSGINDRGGTGNHEMYWFNKMAVGTASGSDLRSVITYENTYAGHLVNNFMSMGACLIDPSGVHRTRYAAS